MSFRGFFVEMVVVYLLNAIGALCNFFFDDDKSSKLKMCFNVSFVHWICDRKQSLNPKINVLLYLT